MNKVILAFGVVGIITYSMPTITARTSACNLTASAYSDDIQPHTAGLIYGYYISASASSGKLILNGYTRTNSTMKSIGYKDISIEYSSDGVNWDEEKPLDDLLKSGSSYYLNDYSVSVVGGYYYRVKLNHYAKESGLFGSSQSVENISNSVWID